MVQRQSIDRQDRRLLHFQCAHPDRRSQGTFTGVALKPQFPTLLCNNCYFISTLFYFFSEIIVRGQ